MILKLLAEGLDCNCEGILNAPSEFRSNRAWIDLSGHKEYDSRTSKSSKMGSPIMKMLHRIISYTLNARNRSNGKVGLELSRAEPNRAEPSPNKAELVFS